jgi:hypothetical protein
MKTLHASAVVAVLLMTVLCSGALLAQQQDQPKPLRFDFTPFAGYRTIMSIPIEPHVSGLNPSIVLDAGPSYGVSFGYWIREDDLVELRWARQSSHIHSDDVALQPPRQSLVIDQFHGDFSHEYLVEDWAEWARPFVMGSVGATYASGVNNLNFTRFSFGIGGGIRFYPTRHLGFKIQAEWLPVVMDPQVAFVCGPGCVVNVRAALSSQGEVIIGPVLHF